MHFACAVFSKSNSHEDLWKLLSPFDENFETPPRVEYTYAQAVAEVRSWKHVDSSQWTDEQCFQYMAEDYSPDLIDANKNLYTRYNPNSRYDWYQIGGRWAGILKASSGMWGDCLLTEHPKIPGRYDSAKIKDIDFSVDENKEAVAKRIWEIIVLQSPLTPEEENDPKMVSLISYHQSYAPQWYRDKYGDCATYVKTCSHLLTHDILWIDGTWISQDNFPNMSDWYDKFYECINQADPEWYLTIIDCHI